MKTITKLLGNTLMLLAALMFIIPANAKPLDKTSQIGPAGSRVFVFDTRALRWTVYANGRPIRSGHAVGGKAYCKDIGRGCRTPVGTFRVYSKQGPNFISSRYPVPTGGARMPWAMFFHGGYAIHGSNDVPSRHASHGCIRVYPSDARWLSTVGLPMGSRVIVRPY